MNMKWFPLTAIVAFPLLFPTAYGQAQTREELYQDALAALANTDEDDAAPRIAKFLEENPSWAQGWALLGRAHQRRRSHEAAVDLSLIHI